MPSLGGLDVNPAFTFYLDGTEDDSLVGRGKRLTTDITDWFTQYRILRIPVLNWCIIVIYAAFLARLSWKFKELYAKQALITTITSNLLLFGLADTLAQTLSAMFAFVPEPEDNSSKFFVKFIIEKGRPRRVILDEADDNLLELGIDTEDVLMDEDWQSEEQRRLATRSRMRAEAFGFRRLALFSVWGFIISFFQSPWYAILNSSYKEDNAFLRALKRVLTDQLCYSPISLAAFLSYMEAVMEGGDRTAIGIKLKNVYLPTLAANYAVWPLAQFLNFLVIPGPLQIPFSSTIGVFWNAYLSLKNARS